MQTQAVQENEVERSKRRLCASCGKKGMTIFKALGKTGFLSSQCQFCGHNESVTSEQYMSRRERHVATSSLAPGVRVKIRGDAVYDDGVVHRFRGCEGAIYKRIQGESEWIVTLDQHGPICMHVSNMEAIAHG